MEPQKHWGHCCFRAPHPLSALVNGNQNPIKVNRCLINCKSTAACVCNWWRVCSACVHKQHRMRRARIRYISIAELFMLNSFLNSNVCISINITFVVCRLHTLQIISNYSIFSRCIRCIAWQLKIRSKTVTHSTLKILQRVNIEEMRVSLHWLPGSVIIQALHCRPSSLYYTHDALV